MMSSKSVYFFLASCSLRLAYAVSECTTPTQLTCTPTTSPPTLDGTLSDWSNVKGITTNLVAATTQSLYTAGDAQMKCQYDSTNIYFAFEIPGGFNFDSTNNEKCAAVAIMMKMGTKATFYNMGGCPDFVTSGESCKTIPTSQCADYLVDIGAHWELKSTTQKTLYAIDSAAAPADKVAVSPVCRVRDANTDSTDGANEWSGAWSHTTSEAVSSRAANSTSSSADTGSYIFEFSRTLTTKSVSTDRQLAAGESAEFGIAYWDPLETSDGWTGKGHYVSGCGMNFLNLVLEASETASNATVSGASPSGSSPVQGPVAKPTSTSGASRLLMGTLQAIVAGAIFYIL